MTWAFRPDIPSEQQLQELEKTIGINNLQDLQFDVNTGYLYLFTDTKKFKVLLTEVT